MASSKPAAPASSTTPQPQPGTPATVSRGNTPATTVVVTGQSTGPTTTGPQTAVALPPTTLAQVANLHPVRSRVNRVTGTRINLWAPLPATPQGGTGTGTWVVQCANHGQHTAHHTTRKAAKATVYQPQFWCTGCAAIVAAKAAPAPAPAPATAPASSTGK
jgi:hypothetical protein